ncbi:OmpA family protein [Arcicella sp. LKC2W]|uniref:OmpA family protein n=1 Tax=Arcicella sp. LKC2W TaxID=2984198 RepID=UPI002B1ED28C|nr:OmpA family protein [Arcicella sp. LKC2W]MEA5460613.1 OmpA family protein [Arcicella sp. LKC2W]
MKRLFLLFSVAILLQSCLGTYPQGSGGYPTNGGNSDGGNSTGGNQYPSGNDRPQTTPQSEPTNYPSTPNSGVGRSADKDLVVGNIRLTDQYTILYLTFKNTHQAGNYQDKNGKSYYDDGTQNIAFQENAILIAANGARTFRALKADNIPFLNDTKARDLAKYGRKLRVGESLNFVVYFERLDKGLETFDLNECNSDNYVCWNNYNLTVSNPADYQPTPTKTTPVPTPTPPTNTDNSPTKSRTKSGKVGEVDNTPPPAPVATNVIVSGIVRDAKTNRPISATIDYKLSSSKQVIDSVQSFASTGVYRMSLQKGQVYTYSTSARGYLVTNDVVDLSKTAGGQKVTKDIYLTPIAVGDKIVLKNIYFEVSKSDLLAASYAELNKLVTMMQDNPMMEIRLEGHTDIVGDPEANLELSQDRVDACETYLVKQGIPSARIQAVGYGDTRPIVKKGTDEERKVNRRVEFVVLKL